MHAIPSQLLLAVTDCVLHDGTGLGVSTKRPHSPDSDSASPTPPLETSPLMPVGRRSKAKASAQIKRIKFSDAAEVSPKQEFSDSSPGQPPQSAGCDQTVAMATDVKVGMLSGTDEQLSSAPKMRCRCSC